MVKNGRGGAAKSRGVLQRWVFWGYWGNRVRLPAFLARRRQSRLTLHQIRGWEEERQTRTAWGTPRPSVRQRGRIQALTTNQRETEYGRGYARPRQPHGIWRTWQLEFWGCLRGIEDAFEIKFDDRTQQTMYALLDTVRKSSTECLGGTIEGRRRGQDTGCT